MFTKCLWYYDIWCNSLFCFLDKRHFCENCGKSYMYRQGLYTHKRFECGKEPEFQCPLCPHRTKRKIHLKSHVFCKHGSTAYQNVILGSPAGVWKFFIFHYCKYCNLSKGNEFFLYKNCIFVPNIGGGYVQ